MEKHGETSKVLVGNSRSSSSRSPVILRRSTEVKFKAMFGVNRFYLQTSSTKSKCNQRLWRPTSYPGSLFFPPGAREALSFAPGGKKRDPEYEVVWRRVSKVSSGS